MPTASLSGVRAKIDRAEYHLRRFHAAIEAWGSSEEDDHLPFTEYDPDRNCLHLRVHKVRPNDPQWPLIVGDAIHNLRATLDHLVCQFALLNGSSSDCCTSTSFPVCTTPESFAKRSKQTKPFISAEAFTFIEELQPYRTAQIAGKPVERSNLLMLHQLDLIDKHRMLVVAAKHVRPIYVAYQLPGEDLVKVDAGGAWRPLEDGAEIARIDFPASPIAGREDKVHVQANTQVQVLFNETGCCADGLEPIDALSRCVKFVDAVVNEAGRQFFGE